MRIEDLEKQDEQATAKKRELLYYYSSLGKSVVFGEELDELGQGFTPSYPLQDVYAYVIKNAALVGREFFVFDIEDPSISTERLYLTSRVDIQSQLNRNTTHQLEPVPIYVVGTSKAARNNFYHWMFQALPAIIHSHQVLRSLGVEHQFLVHSLNGWQKASLRLAKIPEKLLRTVDNDHTLEGKNLVYSSMLSGIYSFRPHPLIVETLRDIKKHSLAESTIAPHQLVFVSRKDSPRRNLENEDAVIAALEPLGFKTVVMTEETLANQVALFARATIIVAAHGAALVNTLFSEAGSTLIEIMPSHYRNPCFFRITQLKGINYRCVLAKGDASEPRHQVVSSVDVSELVAVVKKELTRLNS